MADDSAASRGDSRRATLKSPSGHLVVTGSSPAENRVLMRWAGDVQDRVAQVVGLEMPLAGRSVHLDVLPPAEGAAGGVTVTQEFRAGVVVQRLVIPRQDDATLARAREPLCRLFLNGYVFTRQPGTPQAARGAATNGVASVPPWFSEGIAQNLYPVLKERNIRDVLVRWKSGEFGTVMELIRSMTTSEGTPDRSVAGVFVMWILSRQDAADILSQVFDRTASADPITAGWLAACLAGSGARADLDETWDDWLLQQRRVIYNPGTVSSGLLNQLDSELVAYPGDSGVPLSGIPATGLGPRDWIDRRGEAWIAGLARSKAMALRLQGVGRQQEFQEVVEAYARFLDGLSARRPNEKELRKRLDVAEKKREMLRAMTLKAEQEMAP